MALIEGISPGAIDIICERLRRSSKWRGHTDELDLLFDRLKRRVHSREKPLIDWVSLKLMEKESHRLQLEDAMSEYLPLVAKILLNK